MIIGTRRPEEARVFDMDAGFHSHNGIHIEVFWDDAAVNKYDDEPRNFDVDGEPVKPGWYWWPCLPGCLPDGEPHGPFGSSTQAKDDALDVD